jgi:hypothetical protein
VERKWSYNAPLLTFALVVRLASMAWA